MARVVYSLEAAIENDEKTRNMAVHTAGANWDKLKAALEATGMTIKVKGIGVALKAGEPVTEDDAPVETLSV